VKKSYKFFKKLQKKSEKSKNSTKNTSKTAKKVQKISLLVNSSYLPKMKNRTKIAKIHKKICNFFEIFVTFPKFL